MPFPWGDFGLNLALTAAAVVLVMAVLMTIAIAIKNQSIIDVVWGPGFVVIAAVSYGLSAGSGGDGTRRLVVLLLTAVWGLRLGAYIGRRNLGHGEDRRYTALMRHRQGNLVVFLVRKIYGLQGGLMWLVSLPVQAAMYEHASLGALGAVGIAVWAVGLGFEAVGDWQLARFKADPANQGQVMDRGLWGWTRHPNYFGDSCVWAGLWLLALGSPVGLATVFSPVLMTVLLLKFSGKALLERRMLRSKGDAYAAYLRRTSGFFPLPPRRPRPS
jgi:steroid 5-alpha reductase family enzyme